MPPPNPRSTSSSALLTLRSSSITELTTPLLEKPTQKSRMSFRPTPSYTRAFLGVLLLLLVSLVTLATLTPYRPSPSSSWANPFRPPPPGSSDCPSLTPLSGRIDTPLSHFSSHPEWTCRPLPLTNTTSPTSSSEFSAHICGLPQWCNKFSLFVHRNNQTQCSVALLRQPVTESQELWDYLMNDVGPDSFLVRVSGGQRWTTEKGRWEGCGGGVRFDVTLSTGGPIYLELWRTYENYDAFNELDPLWPTHHFEPLLPHPTRLDICAPHCPTLHAPRAVTPEPSFSLTPPSILFSPPPTNQDLLGGDLPPCGPGGPTEGVYLRWHPMDSLEPPSPIIHQWQGPRPLMGSYQFIPTRCSYLHAGVMYPSPALSGSYLTLPSASGAGRVVKHGDCLRRRKKVYFVGDSHARFAYWNVKHRLEGGGGWDSYDDKAGITDRQYHTIGNLDLLFQWDHHLGFTGIEDEELRSFDGIVMSAGSWATMENWSTSSWLEWYQNILNKFADLDPDNLRPPVFLVPSPYPPHLTGASVERGEHRTNVRLGYIRDKMVEMIEAMGRGWSVVDQFGMGMPVMLEMLAGDGLHLSPGDAQERILDDILAKLDICRPIESWEEETLPPLPDPLVAPPPEPEPVEEEPVVDEEEVDDETVAETIAEGGDDGAEGVDGEKVTPHERPPWLSAVEELEGIVSDMLGHPLEGAGAEEKLEELEEMIEHGVGKGTPAQEKLEELEEIMQEGNAAEEKLEELEEMIEASGVDVGVGEGVAIETLEEFEEELDFPPPPPPPETGQEEEIEDLMADIISGDLPEGAVDFDDR